MRTDPILVVMAAGLGSRFGGFKQLAPLGKNGECLIDYSLFDACRAGFRRVVFIVNDSVYDDFRRTIGSRAQTRMQVEYALQRLETALPADCSVPEGRTKPWGTAHAVLCCQELIDTPFAVVNGDDFYGQDAFGQIYRFLSGALDENEYAMVGYRLSSTLSENGFVSRGVCDVDENGLLRGVVERTHIISSCDGPLYTLDGQTYFRLPPDTPVSMNLWGFPARFIERLRDGFPAFYRQAMQRDPLKGEYFLPFVVNDALREGACRVHVLPTRSVWIGLTHRQDQPAVQEAIDRLTRAGVYPPALWD